MALAFLVGILSTGVIADWLVRRGYSVLTAMICFLVLFLVAQLGIVVGLADEYIQPVWFLFGMLGQAAILAYPWLAAHFGAQRSGRAQTAANLAIFAAAFALQYAIGAVIEQFPQTAPGSYDIRAYQYAFGGTLILQVVALMWYWLNAAAFSQHRRA